jgi:hypothetical protein
VDLLWGSSTLDVGRRPLLPSTELPGVLTL